MTFVLYRNKNHALAVLISAQLFIINGRRKKTLPDQGRVFEARIFLPAYLLAMSSSFLARITWPLRPDSCTPLP